MLLAVIWLYVCYRCLCSLCWCYDLRAGQYLMFGLCLVCFLIVGCYVNSVGMFVLFVGNDLFV